MNVALWVASPLAASYTAFELAPYYHVVGSSRGHMHSWPNLQCPSPNTGQHVASHCLHTSFILMVCLVAPIRCLVCTPFRRASHFSHQYFHEEFREGLTPLPLHGRISHLARHLLRQAKLFQSINFRNESHLACIVSASLYDSLLHPSTS
jgi:hypothetical protein